jgi:hypothetical protein
MILKTAVDRSINFIEFRMNTDLFAFARIRRRGQSATHPLMRLVARLPLSLVVAGPGLPPPHFAADTRPDAPSNASNHGF